MSIGEGGEQQESADVPCHLSKAHNHLLMALLHLAAVEGDVAGEDLLFTRQLISRSMDYVLTTHRGMTP
jgi:hypothetical protein